jgi:hypothetical protein
MAKAYGRVPPRHSSRLGDQRNSRSRKEANTMRMRISKQHNNTALFISSNPITATDHTVAKFDFETSTLDIHEDCWHYLGAILRALREFRKANNLPILPVKVEYW